MLVPLHLLHQYSVCCASLPYVIIFFSQGFHHWRSTCLSLSLSRNLLSSILLSFLLDLLCLVLESDLFFLTPNGSPQPLPVPYHIIVKFQSNVLDGLLSLWKSVAASGLMGEVLSSLQTELLAVFKGVEDRTEKANLQEAGEIWLQCLIQCLKCSYKWNLSIHNYVFVLLEIKYLHK